MKKPPPNSAEALLPTIWDLKDVTPHPGNERTHPPAEIELLAELFRKWGPDQAIVVDERGVIIKGHARREAAIKAGIAGAYPVVQRVGMPEHEKTAMRISDNQSALLAGWDNARVKLAIGVLKLANFPTAILGFGDVQLVQFETVPGPPGSFPTFDENIPVEHECPSCHYKWSGSSAPKVPEEKPAKKKAAAKAKSKSKAAKKKRR